jgi:2-oxoglutarate dehydrogenase E1 component
LTENATVGFEYGYSIQSRNRLVLWEAQYGDFLNMAQPVLDEFLLSARAKWGQTPSLVLLLPHGFEGQGPDHSSARPERLLQLAAEINLRLANCTTAGQYFHLLRRQAALLTSDPLPLLILTPKSLLRQPDTFASLRELSEGQWQPVLDDPKQPDATRLLLCSGKVYFDLLASPERDGAVGVAIARMEQLYPFPVDELAALLARYSRVQEVVWVQEEPENMGAWPAVQPALAQVAGGHCPLRVIARPPNSSPAEGSMAWHLKVQRDVITRAFREPDR